MRSQVIGIATMAPVAIANRAIPKTAGPTARRSITRGICGAQFPHTKPSRKKIAATAQRALDGEEVIRGNRWKSGAASSQCLANLIHDHGVIDGGRHLPLLVVGRGKIGGIVDIRAIPAAGVTCGCCTLY